MVAAMEDEGRSILLVEDDPALALGLSDSLRFEGYRVVHTPRGEKAIELARSLELEIDWSFPIPDRGRGGKELVDDGWIYELAQWFPRMSVYDDVNGWQTEQFLGRGEFYLNFGDYDVEVTVPWDHIVDATGALAVSIAPEPGAIAGNPASGSTTVAPLTTTTYTAPATRLLGGDVEPECRFGLLCLGLDRDGQADDDDDRNPNVLPH